MPLRCWKQNILAKWKVQLLAKLPEFEIFVKDHSPNITQGHFQYYQPYIFIQNHQTVAVVNTDVPQICHHSLNCFLYFPLFLIQRQSTWLRPLQLLSSLAPENGKIRFTLTYFYCFETFDKVGNYMGEGAQQLQEGGVADRSIMAWSIMCKLGRV